MVRTPLNSQYQGGGVGQIPEESSGEQDNPNCMKKLMLVNEIVYEEKIKVSAPVSLKSFSKRLSLTQLFLLAVSPQLQEELLRYFRDHLRARGGE